MPRSVLRHLLPASAAVLFVLPLWFMLAGSLRPTGLAPPVGVDLLPDEPTLDAYRSLPQLLPVADYLRNSALVVALAVPLTVLVASWAGFGIRLLPGRGRRVAVAASLIVMAIPVSALWATRFEVYRATGLLGTLGTLVAPALLATTPFYVLIYAWSFTGVPDHQLQAARLEGASWWRIWRVLAMPQARPATLAVAVLAFTFHWGNFMDALLYLRGQETFTLPLGLQTLQLLNPTDFPLLMAGALMYTLPSVGVFLLALLALALLAACATGGAGGTDPSGSTRIELVLFGDPVETAGYRSLVEAFAREEPDIEVTLSPVATQDQLLARLTASFAGGQPPDLFLINYRKYGQFAEQRSLEPVQGYLDDSASLDEADFAPAALDAFRFDGEQLTCMPQNVSSLAVYYNADLFQQAGLQPPRAAWTWDDFLFAAQALTRDDVYGVGVQPSVIRVAPFVWSNGGEVVDDEDDPTRLMLDSGPARQAVDWFLDLSLRHGVVPPDAAEQSEDAESRFIAGRLGMYLDSRKAVPSLREIEGFAWDVAPLPVAPGGSPATILHGDAYCMSAGSGTHDAAWRFVEFAMGSAGQTLLAESGRTVPSRLDVAGSPAFLEPDEPPASSSVFLDAIPTIRAVPHTPGWSQAEKEADKILEDVFYGRVPRAGAIEGLVATTAPLLKGAGG